MADGLLAPYEYRTYVDPTGQPYSGGLIHTYTHGSLTPATTWTTSTITGGGAVPNSNPIVLDSAGRCVIYLDSTLSYRFIGTTASGVQFFDQDEIGFPNIAPTTQNIVLNRAQSVITGTQNNYAVNSLTTIPGVKVSYLQWNGASACTFTGFDGFSDGDLLFVDNITSLTAGYPVTFDHQNAGSAAANRFSMASGANTVLQSGQRAMFVYDASLVSTGPLRGVTFYNPQPPTHQSLSAATVYLYSSEPVLRGIGANPWTGQVTVQVTQTSGADAGGTVTVLSDTANPPVTTILAQAYGPGVAQITSVVNVLAGEYFKIVLTGSATNRTVTIGFLGGTVT